MRGGAGGPRNPARRTTLLRSRLKHNCEVATTTPHPRSRAANAASLHGAIRGHGIFSRSRRRTTASIPARARIIRSAQRRVITINIENSASLRRERASNRRVMLLVKWWEIASYFAAVGWCRSKGVVGRRAVGKRPDLSNGIILATWLMLTFPTRLHPTSLPAKRNSNEVS